MTPAVELKSISKRFGAVQALDSVSLRVMPNEIHALVGENGAGKTTLMKVLYGSYRQDSGEILLGGQAQIFHKEADAIGQGIGMVSQHYSVIPELTCLENLMLGAEPSLVIDSEAAETRANELADRMGFSFRWHDAAAARSPSGAQKLEILKLLWRNSKVLILDEPTAMLSPSDSDLLYASLKKLVSEGATVIVVTHRLPEVLGYCDNVTVLRAGKFIESKAVADTCALELAEAIVGHSVTQRSETRHEIGEPVLQVEHATVTGDRGDHALKDISFEVRQGEIVGIAGVDGSGQRELFRALVGVQKLESGTAFIAGQDIARLSTIDRYRIGLRVIPEDRHAEGVIEDWSLEENAALGLHRLEPYRAGVFVSMAYRKERAGKIAERFSTRHGGLNKPMESLSGGNQQRFVAARCLELSPKLIIAFQPARGLDIEATARVYEGLREQCREGAAALVVSFDLDELLAQCHRVVVLCNGILSQPRPEFAMDRQEIGRLMVGAG